MTVLITGPVRSGKSELAKALALERGGPVVFIATARVDPADAEFVARVERHRADRPGGWTTIEAAGPPRLDLAEAIARLPAGTCAIVDSLGTWFADHLLDMEALAEREPANAVLELEALGKPLLAALAATAAEVIVVSEETGWGIVPATPLGRVFRDALGRLNQAVAASAARAYLAVAGYALDLKTGRSVRS
jgi:adenosylcobinamide kinase/adenosylcobinamide-phosphate guanylyltransferase